MMTVFSFSAELSL